MDRRRMFLKFDIYMMNEDITPTEADKIVNNIPDEDLSEAMLMYRDHGVEMLKGLWGGNENE